MKEKDREMFIDTSPFEKVLIGMLSGLIASIVILFYLKGVVL